MKLLKPALLAAALLCASQVHAQATAAPAGEMTDAEVRKIDKDAGKITLKHAEIKSLDMPPMTMVFRVKDAKMLDSFKPGDKIKIQAERIDGQYTVTRAEPAKP